MVVSRLVLAEFVAARETVRLQQVIFLVQDTLRSVLQYEEKQGMVMPCRWQTILFPGGEPLEIELKVRQDEKLGLRQLHIAARDGGKQKYDWYQVRWSFTRVVRQLAASYALIAQGSLQDDTAEWEQFLYTSKTGANFPNYTVRDFTIWQVESCLAPVDLRTYGLGGNLYLHDTMDTYKLPEDSVVHGEGILIFEDGLTLGNRVTFTDRVVIFTAGNLCIGSDVNLQQALIFCNGRLSVGDRSKIRGVIFVKEGAELGTGVEIQHDPGVTAPFSTLGFQG